MSATRTLSNRISEELLPCVKQPAQYIGREINQLAADGDWRRATVRIAVAFPDTYAIGMSHLGCHILYWIINHTPGACAERCYTPAIDAERLMREKKIPLFTWDTRQPVATADIFAVSLQYEMGYTNLLTMLELAGIPKWSAQRDDTHPLVIAGGPQADNPEPIADFLDLVVMGDGEHAIAAIIDAYQELKAGGTRRREMIEIMARRFPWIYAPHLYQVGHNPDGTLSGMTPTVAGLPPNIERCRTPDFENAPFPVRPLVPYAQVVHDRMAIEIMRGCPQRCRFCHAGYTKRPLGLRSVDKILDIAEQQYRATGYSELGLLSLSTGDYPHLNDLGTRVNERFAPRKVNISMPSLRVDRMLRDIPWMARSVRKSGLTIAVEAATDMLRGAIHKKVTDGNLMDGLIEAYKAGWRRIKCYFMVGFPGETDADIRAIHPLCEQMSLARKQLGQGPANITASIGWLVPKPHTPFQWSAQQRAAYFQHARRILAEMRRNGRVKAVRIRTHDPERSVLEAVLSRGDRRLAPVIAKAHELGARFDGWDEHFNHNIWVAAFDAAGVDPDWYAHRERDISEVLPWDHIRPGHGRDTLARQYRDVFAKLQQPMPTPGILPRSPAPASADE